MAEPTNGNPSPRPPEPPKENIKETIESILIAFILAFVFRAFVVEAFVIPSGSMAPTLLGAHMRMRCEECGYEFTANYPARTADDDTPQIGYTAGQITSFPMHCPNCGFKVPKTSSDPRQAATNSPVYYGDRILVLKYLYLLHEPQRWDVVVFKSPYDQKPPQKHVQNYIKRLVGKPGESLMVLDGDVYVSRDNSGPTESRQWQVQTKPRSAQEALWRVVYDNDYYPRNVLRSRPWTMPWRQADGSGWNKGGPNGPGRILNFDNASGAGMLTFDKDANEGTYPLTDWLAYDDTMASAPDGDNYDKDAYRRGVPRWYVSDLKLKFTYHRQSGAGPFKAVLTKLGHEFTAELQPGEVRLIHRLPGGKEQLVGAASLAFAGAGPLEVELSNADYRVTLRVNGRDVLQTTPQEYHPDVDNLLERYGLLSGRGQSSRNGMEKDTDGTYMAFECPQIRLIGQQQTCSVEHLSLWRDVYYTPWLREQRLLQGGPENPITLHTSAQKRPGADDYYDNEYFVLGDNSILSLDARLWDKPINLEAGEDLEVDPGRVPERFLLGKAFFVYWPAGYRPFSVSTPGFVPNSGDMRFIH